MLAQKAIRNRLVLAFLPALLLAALGSLVANHAIMRFVYPSSPPLETNQVIEELHGLNQSLLNLIVDRQSVSQNQSRGLANLQPQESHITQHIDSLTFLVSGNPVQLQRLRKLSETLKLTKQGQAQALLGTSNVDSVDRWSRQIGEALSLSQEMERSERTVLAAQIQNQTTSIQYIQRWILIFPTSAVLVTLFFVSCFAVRDQRKIRQVRQTLEAIGSGDFSQIKSETSIFGLNLNVLVERMRQYQQDMMTRHKTLIEESARDPLTGLYNRRRLERILDKGIDPLEGTWSVIFIDIDHFKRINDTYGHETGDQILQAVGHLISHQIRSTDTSFRYGGEEFVVMLPKVELSQARKRADELREATKNIQVKLEDAGHTAVTISAGVAEFPTHGSDLRAVIAEADRAMYRAKDAGRDQVVVAEV